MIFSVVVLLLTPHILGSDGWKAVRKGVLIDFDLENTPLEIKTNSTVGSKEKIDVELYTAQEKLVGYAIIEFSKPAPQYYISRCRPQLTNFSTVPPSIADKIWRITLTRTVTPRIVIHCNEVEVLYFTLSNSTCIKNSKMHWSYSWNRAPVVKIKFYKQDTASNSYRAAPGHPCPEIKVDNALVSPPSHGNADENTVVTVRCATPNPYVLIGDEEVTCQSEGWTSVPKCRKCGMSETEEGTVYVEDKSEGNLVGSEDDPDNYTCSKSSLVRRMGEDGEPVIESSMEQLSVSKEDGDEDTGTPDRVAVSKTVSKSAEGKSGSASAVSKMSASSSVSKSGSTKTASLSASAHYSSSSKTSSSSSSSSGSILVLKKMSSSSKSSSSSSSRVVSSSSSSYSSSRSSSHSSSYSSSSSSSRSVTSSSRIVSSSSSSSSKSIKGSTQKAVKE